MRVTDFMSLIGPQQLQQQQDTVTSNAQNVHSEQQNLQQQQQQQLIQSSQFNSKFPSFPAATISSITSAYSHHTTEVVDMNRNGANLKSCIYKSSDNNPFHDDPLSDFGEANKNISYIIRSAIFEQNEPERIYENMPLEQHKRDYQNATITTTTNPTTINPTPIATTTYTNPHSQAFNENQDILNENWGDKNCHCKDNNHIEHVNVYQETEESFNHYPKRLRGIVNPNYPGFQHLAHELTEHCIECEYPDMYDSDSVISNDETNSSSIINETFAEEQDQQHYENATNDNNNNNNNNSEQASEGEKMSVNITQNTKESTGIEPGAVEVDEQKSKKLNENEKERALQDLLSYHHAIGLTLLKPSATDPDLTRISSWNSNSMTVQTPNPKPDILGEDNIWPRESETQPDLLKGVKPPLLFKKQAIVQAKETEESLKVPVLRSPHIVVKSDMSNDGLKLLSSVTPVDIIGDFRQEVEREFGLLVHGYRRFENECEHAAEQSADKIKLQVPDALLSKTEDHIDSNKFLAALSLDDGNNRELITEIRKDKVMKTATEQPKPEQIEEKNEQKQQQNEDQRIQDQNPEFDNNHKSTTTTTTTPHYKQPVYQKYSYDDRQLPPVGMDYGHREQNSRASSTRKTQRTTGKSTRAIAASSITTTTTTATTATFKTNNTKSQLHNKKDNKNPSPNHHRTQSSSAIKKHSFENKQEKDINKKSNKSNSKQAQLDAADQVAAEMLEYQELINNKELILNNSRYAKMSSWAYYLKNSVNNFENGKNEIISPSGLSLFNAYKIGPDFDVQRLQKHLKMAKEIEEKRRNDREEIRRRLAIGSDETTTAITNSQTNFQPRVYTGLNSWNSNDAPSDTESYSSDSETCPKLSRKFKQSGGTTKYSTIKSSNRQTGKDNFPADRKPKKLTKKQQQHQTGSLTMTVTDEDRETCIFTRQAQLQIETRVALDQAKTIAHTKMQLNSTHRRITGMIRTALASVGVVLEAEKRRVCRQMLTEMSIDQLRILANTFQDYIKDLNETLVEFLTERDDAHVSQDLILADVEKLSIFVGTKEDYRMHAQQRNKRPISWNI